MQGRSCACLQRGEVASQAGALEAADIPVAILARLPVQEAVAVVVSRRWSWVAAVGSESPCLRVVSGVAALDTPSAIRYDYNGLWKRVPSSFLCMTADVDTSQCLRNEGRPETRRACECVDTEQKATRKIAAPHLNVSRSSSEIRAVESSIPELCKGFLRCAGVKEIVAFYMPV